MPDHNNTRRRRPRATGFVPATTTLLLATASLTNAHAPSKPRALVTIEATNHSNTTISIPLRTLYTNDALSSVSALYLTGAVNLDISTITCYPFKNSDLTGSGGQAFSQFRPSRLSTTSVHHVGSIVCSSSDDDVTPSYDDTAGVTSTLHATTTELTRGHVSDVPNLYNASVPLGPGPVIISSSLPATYPNATLTTSTSTSTSSLPTVTNDSGDGGLVGPPRTVTSIAVITPTSGGNGTNMVTSTVIEVIVPAPATSRPTSSNVATFQSNQSAAAAVGRNVLGMVVVGLLGWVGVGVLGA